MGSCCAGTTNEVAVTLDLQFQEELTDRDQESKRQLLAKDEAIQELKRKLSLNATIPDPIERNADYLKLVQYNDLLMEHMNDLSYFRTERIELSQRDAELRASIPQRYLADYIATRNPEDPTQAFQLFVVGAYCYSWKRIAEMSVEKQGEISSDPDIRNRLEENLKTISSVETEQFLQIKTKPLEKRMLWYTLIIYFYTRPILMYQYSIKNYLKNFMPAEALPNSFWRYFARVVETSPVQHAFQVLNQESSAVVVWRNLFRSDSVKARTFYETLTGLHGLCALNGIIFISNRHKNSLARTIIVLLRELVHMGKRLGKIEAYFEIPPAKSSSTLPTDRREDGDFLETSLFGGVVEKIYSSSERFLELAENWQLEADQFRKQFQEIQQKAEKNKEESTCMCCTVGWSHLVCGTSGKHF